MLPFKIGNWVISNEGICHVEKPNYLISKASLFETGPNNRRKMFDWLVHMPTKTWCSTKEDIYTLNSAFIYAAEAYNLTYPADISFVETLIEQAKILDIKSDGVSAFFDPSKEAPPEL